MLVAERDFSNFQFDNNVYELAGGLLPDMADKLEVELGDTPDADSIQAMLNKVGTKRELRENTGSEDYMTLEETVDFIDRSGLQKAIDRDLHDGNQTSVQAGVKDAIVQGAVANWADRTTALVVAHKTIQRVWTLGGNRKMQLGTEVTNSNIIHVQDAFNRRPTEAQYLGRFILPTLLSAGKEVLPFTYPTNDGDTILRAFFEENPDLLEQRLLLARVANSGIIMGFQLREAARKLNANFDSDPTSPQVYVATDGFPLARTEAQQKDAANFQNPVSAIKQVILTGKKIVLAQAAERERQASLAE